ncbi:hypothetical protein [Glutamicibacter arilaitensis]|uniref:hypothetical protein n=1 Tax=Glutamicibacter arilaitensis TaxID=256701 RepID=UPI003A91AAE9
MVRKIQLRQLIRRAKSISRLEYLRVPQRGSRPFFLTPWDFDFGISRIKMGFHLVKGQGTTFPDPRIEYFVPPFQGGHLHRVATELFSKIATQS